MDFLHRVVCVVDLLVCLTWLGARLRSPTALPTLGTQVACADCFRGHYGHAVSGTCEVDMSEKEIARSKEGTFLGDRALVVGLTGK